MKALLESKQNMGKECKQAFFLIAEAKYAAGEFQYAVHNSGARSLKLSKRPPLSWTNPSKILPVS